MRLFWYLLFAALWHSCFCGDDRILANPFGEDKIVRVSKFKVCDRSREDSRKLICACESNNQVILYFIALFNDEIFIPEIEMYN